MSLKCQVLFDLKHHTLPDSRDQTCSSGHKETSSDQHQQHQLPSLPVCASRLEFRQLHQQNSRI